MDSIANSYPVTMTVTNGVCSDTRKKTILISPDTSALRSAALFKGISFVHLYPNPSPGNCHLEIKTFEPVDMCIEMLDAGGNSLGKINTHSDNFNEPLNFDQLTPGLYFLKLQAGREQRVLKLVINN